MDEIVYFQCNDWSPEPEEANRLIYGYLNGDMPNNKYAILKSFEEIDEWLINNEVCVSCAVYDMSINFWVTCKKKWLECNFPEMLPFASKEPQDFLFDGDRKYFLKHDEKNFGCYFDIDIDYEIMKDRCIEYEEPEIKCN